MKYSSVSRGFHAGNPIANIFVIVVGALAIGLSVVLGFVALVLLGSIIVVLASIIGVRVWWLNRRLRSNREPAAGTSHPPPGGVIEGEYQVVEDEGENERKT